LPIRIHPKRRPQLVAAIAKALQAAKVDGLLVDYDSLEGLDAAEDVLKEEVVELKKYISEDRPLAWFAFGFIMRMVKHRDFAPQGDKLLSQIAEAPPLPQLAEQIVLALEALPTDYAVSVALPPAIDNPIIDGGPWSIGSNASIAKGQPFKSRLPVEPSDQSDPFQLYASRLFGGAPYQPDAAHLTVFVRGHLEYFSTQGPTYQAADHAIRTFFGLALVFGAVVYRARSIQPAPVDAYVHACRLQPAQPVLKFTLNTSTSRAIQHLYLAEPPNGWAAKASWPSLAGGRSGQIGLVLDHPRAERLRRAARWHFDGHGADNVLMGYLQAMICLEILLGEPDPNKRDLSVGAMLRNRCAYLIGSDLEERDEILAKLKDIYDVRSEIVHNGLGTLSSHQRNLLATLRWYCSRVMAAEARRLPASGSALDVTRPEPEPEGSVTGGAD